MDTEERINYRRPTADKGHTCLCPDCSKRFAIKPSQATIPRTLRLKKCGACKFKPRMSQYRKLAIARKNKVIAKPRGRVCL